MSCICCDSYLKNCVASNQFFNGVDVVQCLVCGLVYPDPRPNLDAVIEFYRDAYYAPGKFILRKLARSIALPHVCSRFEWIIRRIHIPEKHPQVLDIGCGYGQLLRLFKKANWEITGIEPSRDCAGYINGQLGKKIVYCGSLEEFSTTKKFDLIILSHTFEHFVAPEEIIEQLKTILKPGGSLFIEIPNKKSRLFSKDYSRTSDFYYFSMANFRSFTRKHGFVVLDAEYVKIYLFEALFNALMLKHFDWRRKHPISFRVLLKNVKNQSFQNA